VNPQKPYLVECPNGQPFRATLEFSTRKEAVEAYDLIDVLHRNNWPNIKPFARTGRGKKNVTFYCDSTTTALQLRACYFRGSTVTWFKPPVGKDGSIINVRK
jgi:hypothetical protein